MMETQEPDEHTQQNKMLPPPVGTFQTREDLLKHVRDFALAQGYMVSIKDSSKDRYVTISCDRGGVYRKRLKTGENMRRRKAPSRLTNCSFEVVGKRDDDLWTLTVKNREHNHEPSEDISDHPSCRRFTEEEVVIIREMTEDCKRPCQILKVLRQRNPNLVSVSRNVYNVKAKIRREILSGQKMESPSTSSAATLDDAIMASTPRDSVMPNGVEVSDSTQSYLDSFPVTETRTLVSELCRHFYTLGWVSGTGGSITIKVHDDSIPRALQLIVMSPSGVQRERMVPDDMYVLSSEGFILSTPPFKPFPHSPTPPKCTDCAPIFVKAYEMRNAGAVIHSHGVEACLITHMEMINGIQGHGYHDELVVPIIENAASETELTESLVEAIRDYPKTTAVLVRNHGVYIWGDTRISAKTQAECYHYLFDAAIKLHQLGLDWSTASHGPIRHSSGVCGCKRNINKNLNSGTQSLDYMVQPSQRCILLDIGGTTTPISFERNVLFPCVNEKMIKHLDATYDTKETQDDISLLRTQIQSDLEEGIIGAMHVPPDYMGKESVIASLAANVVAMISADRKVTSLEQLQGRILQCGFQSNELVGVVFDDVPEALERWQSAGIKVYIYSSCSREAQQLLFGNSIFGDLRKYFCGFFDTKIGNKIVTGSYIEIMKTMGIDRPADLLFVTYGLQEAIAAKAAGLEVILSIRPGNGPLPGNHGFRTIDSLLDI